MLSVGKLTFTSHTDKGRTEVDFRVPTGVIFCRTFCLLFIADAVFFSGESALAFTPVIPRSSSRHKTMLSSLFILSI